MNMQEVFDKIVNHLRAHLWPHIYGYLKKHFSDNEIYLIRELQDIHDGVPIYEWEMHFKSVADRRALTYHEPK